MKINYLLIIALFSILASCFEKGESDTETVGIQPEVLKTIEAEIPEDYFQPLSMDWHHKVIENDDYFFTGGMQEDIFYIFPLNVTTEKYEKTIKIPQQGPEGFQSTLVRYYVHNFDSIFIFPHTSKHFYLYNTNGKIINKFNIPTTEFVSITSADAQSTFIVEKESITLGVAPYKNPNNKDFISESPPVYQYNFSDNTFSPFLDYPDYLNGKILPIAFLGSQNILAFDSLILTSFYFSEEIFFQNINDEYTGNFKAGLNSYTHIKGLDREVNNGDITESFYNRFRYPMYKSFSYDTYRKKIFRGVTYVDKKYVNLGVKEFYREVFSSPQRDDLIRVSLIQINSELKIEKIFDVPKCNFYFPVKEGLFVCSYDEKETKNIFQILKLD